MKFKINKKIISILLHVILLSTISGSGIYYYLEYNKIEKKTKNLLKKNGIMKSSIQKLSRQMYKTLSKELKSSILDRHNKNYRKLEGIEITKAVFIEDQNGDIDIYVDKNKNFQYFKINILFKTTSFKALKKLLVIKYLDPKVDKIIEVTNRNMILIHKEKI